MFNSDGFFLDQNISSETKRSNNEIADDNRNWQYHQQFLQYRAY